SEVQVLPDPPRTTNRERVSEIFTLKPFFLII
ncbi:uncharacterized protein METZ01_LOCUS339038, partial [marine metagenome]